MNVRFRTLRLTKLVPLSISRGTSFGSYNLYVFLERDGKTGVGECAPGTGHDDSLAGEAGKQLQALLDTGISELSIRDVWKRAYGMGVVPPAIAAIDTALWDLLAKEAGMPLYRMLGLDRPIVATSVTVGIMSPEQVRERVPTLIDRTRPKSLKIKLGSSDGIRADQDMYEAVRKIALPQRLRLRVDANGGWSVDSARTMISWLADRGCDYVEQPLAKDQEADMPKVFEGRKLPIFLDESCHFAHDVPRIHTYCDGVNLKLMKCGGITEALRIIATANACGLKTMIGCMGESSVAIAAGVAISSLVDHIDLDSHLNLNPDPARGLKMVSGVVLPTDKPGHGVALA